jgi:hypothetical protein
MTAEAAHWRVLGTEPGMWVRLLRAGQKLRGAGGSG